MDSKDYIIELKKICDGNLLKNVEFLENHEGQYIAIDSTLKKTKTPCIMIFYINYFLPGRRYAMMTLIYATWGHKYINTVEKIDINDILHKKVILRELTKTEKLLYAK